MTSRRGFGGEGGVTGVAAAIAGASSGGACMTTPPVGGGGATAASSTRIENRVDRRPSALANASPLTTVEPLGPVVVTCTARPDGPDDVTAIEDGSPLYDRRVATSRSATVTDHGL